MKFSQAIVRPPSKNFVQGLTEANLGLPILDKAQEQHTEYVSVLKKCGLTITVLEPDESYPDSTFVEDTAILTPNCAVITNPGAEARKGETEEIQKVLEKIFINIQKINPPGTLDGGDVMMVGSQYFIGLSQRTNQNGARQLIKILEASGLSGSTVKLKKMLHLKSGLSYLENKNLVLSDEFFGHPEFQRFTQLQVDPEESYAANCLWINDYVLIASGFPKIKQAIKSKGYDTIELDMSEFRKLDGGLSCLSLRF